MAPKSRSGVIRQAIGPVRGRLINNIKEAGILLTRAITDDETECHTANDDISELSDKIKSNITTLNDKDNLWREIILGLDDDDISEEELIYTKAALDPTDGYLTAVEQGKELLCKLERKTKEVTRRIDQIQIRSSAGAAECQPRQTAVNVKLPKLSLPTFDGNYCDWPQFWGIFKTNVHDRDLSPSEKFAYLLGQLSGSALKSIEGLPVNDGNYASAIAILQQRFERSDTQMIGTLYSQLKKLPTASARVGDMMSTFDSCERIFRQLEAVGEKTDANRSLVLDLLSKYPGDVVKDLMERFNVGPHSTVAEVREGLQKHIRQSQCLSEVLEDLSPFNPKEGSKSAKSVGSRSGSGESEVQKSYVQTSAFTAPSSRNAAGAWNTPQNPCYFCEHVHFNSRCDKYTTAQQRHDRLRSLKRCFKCLSAAHVGEDCRAPDTKIRCFFCKSVGQHVSPLCPNEFKATSKGDSKTSSSGSAAKETTGLLNANEQALLLTASTVVCNPTTRMQTTARVIFDSGSHRSYITSACARRLKLQELREDSLRVSVFGTKRSLTVASHQVQLQVRESDGNMRSVYLHTTPIITGCPISPAKLPSPDLAMIRDMRCELADDCGSGADSVDILIGSDYFWEFIVGSKISAPSGLFLIPSTLGLLIGGRHAERETDSFESPVLLCITETYSKIPCESGLLALKSRANPKTPDIDEFWCLERIGISDDPVVNDDDEALSHFNNTVLFEEGRYHVRWPWKKNIGDLPNNFELSLGRFNGLARKLKSAPDVLKKYDDVIQDQLKKGVIEKVEEKFGDFRSCPNSVHYLPHHPVIKLSSATTKLRIVYDASAKRSKLALSLNECLHRGRVLLPDLCHVLIRFRLHRVGVVADVEKAFLQMVLQRSERDVTRFIWFSDTSTPEVADNLSTFRFCRVPFGIISSPFLLGATIQYHLKHQGTPVASEIVDNIYVDNVISGVDTADEATNFYAEAKQLFNVASMNLQEWASNSSSFLNSLPNDDLASTGVVKVLGMNWDCSDDTISLKETSDLNAQTKREVLQAIASVYDPLGVFQPVLLRAKLFLRELWEKSKGWDEPLSPEATVTWESVRAEVAPLFAIRIPRVPAPVQPSDEVSLVAFCDASSKAYATAVYLRCRSRGASVWTTNLVYAKSRLTPRKADTQDVTLPRLELLGLLIGARAGRFVSEALRRFQPVPVYAFTDSMCVLHWVNSAKPLSVFVENRIREIKQLKMAEVRYVSTSENPADVSTRGSSAQKLEKNELWWHGPPWLGCSVDSWPRGSVVDLPDGVRGCVESEIRKGAASTVLVVGEDPRGGHATDGQVMGIDITRFSSLRKLFRVTAICLKFVILKVWAPLANDVKLNTNPEVRHVFNSVSVSSVITGDDLRTVRCIWLRAVQRHCFASLDDAIRGGRNHHLRRQLGVKRDNVGILRCHGRLDNTDADEDTIAPILLPTNSPLTVLVVRDVHERLLHSGVGHTLSQIRRAFWIPRGRSVVKRVLNRCVVCKKSNGPAFALPDMPPWPKERVGRSSPFQYTGLDYFGPINVRVGDNIQKMWVCLFTCLAIRAVHLEWVSDCSSEEFLRALVRFVARRGTPRQVISDNAPQFRVTKTALDKIWSRVLTDDSVLSYVANEGIVWKFTTELAPWQGGFYERLVGVVKRALKVGVGRTMLSWEQLITMVTEVEAIVNSRPITYVYSDFPSITTLRPVDFITELATGLPSMDTATRPRDMGDAGRELIRYWKYKQRRLDQLWQFWYDEYVLSLRERGQRAHRQKKGSLQTFPKLDEVVIVKNTDLPRGAWKLARVTNVIRSADDEVRSCELVLPNGVTLRRPINHLYRLEVDSVNDDVDDGNADDDVDEGNPGDGNRGGDPELNGDELNDGDTSGANANDAVRDGATNGESDVEIVASQDPVDFDGFTGAEADAAAARVRRTRNAGRVNIVSNLAVAAYRVCFP